MAKSQMYLNAATTYDFDRDGGGPSNKILGRDNLVTMPLWAAVTLMSPSQKNIVDELLWHQACIENVGVAMGDGFHHPGLIEIKLKRGSGWTIGIIYITARGKVTGTIWPLTPSVSVEIKNFAQLRDNYLSLSLYPSTEFYREPFENMGAK